jgi:hypothetical protein
VVQLHLLPPFSILDTIYKHMILQLYIKPSTLMDNSPRESLAKITRDSDFSMSANVDTNSYRLEWADSTETIIKLTKRIPTILTDVQ